jgi:UDP-N-acetylglucosamine--N-acetylmuramyl-(pentapeptide) pyrophosphoryl-undecaprenol N-acetylglucosamine transferase
MFVTSPSTPLRLLIAAGGTGGHVLSAVAVIEELRTRDIPVEILWVGSHVGVERDIARSHGVPFVAIQTGKLRRYLSVQTVTDMLRIPVGIAQAWRQVRAFQPNVIFSTGGAVSVPTVVAGSRIAPVITHEQTAQVGIANRTAARFAKRFAVAFEETAEIARKHHAHVVITGNPVRAFLAEGDKDCGWEHFGLSPDLPVVFVTGGARGASPINQRIETLLPELLERAQVVHQTGPAVANDDAARLRQKRDGWPPELQSRYVVQEFLGSEIADLYAITDLVIGRAGAGTVSELAYLGMPAILIPLPGTWGDEQRKNARVLGNADAAVVLEQADATPERLGQEITTLLDDVMRRNAMGANAKRISRPDAAARLVDEILGLAEYGEK